MLTRSPGLRACALRTAHFAGYPAKVQGIVAYQKNYVFLVSVVPVLDPEIFNCVFNDDLIQNVACAPQHWWSPDFQQIFFNKYDKEFNKKMQMRDVGGSLAPPVEVTSVAGARRRRRRCYPLILSSTSSRVSVSN